MATPIIAHICKKGCYIFTKELAESQIKFIENTFTIRNKNIMGRWIITKCYKYYKVSGELCVLIPRFGPRFICKKIPLIARSEIPQGVKTEFNLTAQFRGNQEIIFNSLFDTYFSKKEVKKGMAGIIIDLPPGMGKSYLGLHIIKKIGLRTMIIVHNELILKQWRDIIMQYMPNVRLGLFYGKQKTADENSQVIISIINSALKYENWNEIGMVLFDEAHMFTSINRSEIYNICQSTYMVAMTATPEQQKEVRNNNYKLIQWHIGPIMNVEELPGYTAADNPFQGKVRMIKYYGPPEKTKTHMNEILDMVSNPKMIQQLTEDQYRLKLIVKLTREIMQIPETNLFIFANRRDYLTTIHERLLTDAHINALFLTTPTEEKAIMTIMGQSKEEDVLHAEQNSRLILTTYQYFGTGKSLPKMNAMILGTPFRTGSKQYIGRIFRLGSDPAITRLIYDIVDWETPLKSQWYSRKKFYDEQEYPIEIESIKWTALQNP